jgi:hypothetical protein
LTDKKAQRVQRGIDAFTVYLQFAHDSLDLLLTKGFVEQAGVAL